jgi:hypothetical protein
VFGAIVALMGCYHGMNSGRGAQGVGRATKRAVVAASGADPGVQLPADRGVLHRMIAFQDVHKAFGANKVLQGITLEVPKGPRWW